MSSDNEHKLWNFTKYLKRPTKRNIPVKNSNGEWCRSDISKANTFKEHLKSTFCPFILNSQSVINDILNFLDIPYQTDRSIKHINLR